MLRYGLNCLWITTLAWVEGQLTQTRHVRTAAYDHYWYTISYSGNLNRFARILVSNADTNYLWNFLLGTSATSRDAWRVASSVGLLWFDSKCLSFIFRKQPRLEGWWISPVTCGTRHIASPRTSGHSHVQIFGQSNAVYRVTVRNSNLYQAPPLTATMTNPLSEQILNGSAPPPTSTFLSEQSLNVSV